MLPASFPNGMCRKTAVASKPLDSNRMEFQICSSSIGINERLRAYPHVFDVLFHHDGSPLGTQPSLEWSPTRRQYDVRLQILAFAFHVLSCTQLTPDLTERANHTASLHQPWGNRPRIPISSRAGRRRSNAPDRRLSKARMPANHPWRAPMTPQDAPRHRH